MASGETCLGGEHPHPAGTRGWDQPQPPARGGVTGHPPRTPKAPAWVQHPGRLRDEAAEGTVGHGDVITRRFVLAEPRQLHPTAVLEFRGPRSPQLAGAQLAGGGGGGAQLAGAGGVGGRLRVGGPAAAGPASLRGAGARARVCGSRICASPCPPGTQAPSGAVGTQRRGKLLTGTPSPPGSRDRACKQGEVLFPPRPQ